MAHRNSLPYIDSPVIPLLHLHHSRSHTSTLPRRTVILPLKCNSRSPFRPVARGKLREPRRLVHLRLYLIRSYVSLLTDHDRHATTAERSKLNATNSNRARAAKRRRSSVSIVRPHQNSKQQTLHPPSCSLLGPRRVLVQL